MKELFFISTTIFLFVITGCKKEKATSIRPLLSTVINKPPIANAGKDLAITLPTDSVVLDGLASYDPDGKIVSYLWKQVSGPSTAVINNSQISITNAGNFTVGIYSFELKVTDDGGLASTASVSIEVKSQPIRVVAKAGPDQVLKLPTNTAVLDGSMSNDPSGTPLNFLWRQISGTKVSINGATSKIATIMFSQPDYYEFVLQVSNTNGIAYSTTKVTVDSTDMLSFYHLSYDSTLDCTLSVPNFNLSQFGNNFDVLMRICDGPGYNWFQVTKTSYYYYEIVNGSIRIRDPGDCAFGYSCYDVRIIKR
ncbi:MAG TPA: PKD domain-containing protein [Chitinophagaceae bacterium]|nr:PKD domain-containing protein [Chitinophagaceae bacterium]